jgi:hypothetical protein
VDFTDLTHQAEHTRTAAEQREADVCARELAASLAALCHSFAGPIGALHRTFQGAPAGLRAGRTFRTESG